MKTSARFSTDARHRYELRYCWDERLPIFVTIMLNPSIANAYQLDPTCKGVMKRAAHLGFGTMVVLNVGAGISTDPVVWLHMRDPVGPQNYDTIRSVMCEIKCKRHSVVVAGWGTMAPPEYVRPVLSIARDLRVDLYCYDETLKGHPKHPLYVPQVKGIKIWRTVSDLRRELD